MSSFNLEHGKRLLVAFCPKENMLPENALLPLPAKQPRTEDSISHIMRNGTRILQRAEICMLPAKRSVAVVGTEGLL